MEKIKVGIIGATGYAGVELVRLLHSHPNVEVVAMSSVSYEGKKLSDVYPAMYNIHDDILVSEDVAIAKSQIIFASLPHGLCEKIGRKCVDKGVKLIDLGADFRLDSEQDYQEWYKLTYQDKELHKLSAYCIPELHRDRLTSGVEIVGNPGCYPTSIALGLAPLVAQGLVDTNTIVIDSKSGVTGAGRSLTQTTHYPDCNEAFSPYKVASHRHTPEIEQTLSQLASKDIKVTFVPHLLPVNRGIISTIYATMSDKWSQSMDINAIYNDFYKGEKFVRIIKSGEVANLKNVKYSNYCDISLHLDIRSNRVVIVSTIDNMVKGAAGQAIQNMNILLGLEEGAGLDFVPPCF